MPHDHGLRFHDGQNIRPSRPQMPQGDPEETIPSAKGWARPLTLEHCDLLPQCEDFKRDVRSTAEEHTDGGEESEDHREHQTVVVTYRKPQAACLSAGLQIVDSNT